MKILENRGSSPQTINFLRECHVSHRLIFGRSDLFIFMFFRGNYSPGYDSTKYFKSIGSGVWGAVYDE